MSTGLSVRELLQDHVKAYALSPSQTVDVLLNYIVLRTMFPEVSLAFYLERYRRLVGADANNLKFPKTALDHYCPKKGSAWPPKLRTELMLRYVEVLDLLQTQSPPGELPFAAFLQSEAPVVAAAASGSPAATEAPPVAADLTIAEPSATAEPPAPAASGATAAPLQLGLGEYTTNQAQADTAIVEAGLIYDIFERDGRWFAGFVTAAGNLREDAEVERLRNTGGEVNPAAVIQLSAADYQTALQFLEAAGPVPTHQIGEPLIDWVAMINLVDDGGESRSAEVLVQVYNAHPKPRVRSYLLLDGAPVAELRPRQSLLGYYPLTYKRQVYLTQVLIGSTT